MSIGLNENINISVYHEIALQVFHEGLSSSYTGTGKIRFTVIIEIHDTIINK